MARKKKLPKLRNPVSKAMAEKNIKSQVIDNRRPQHKPTIGDFDDD